MPYSGENRRHEEDFWVKFVRYSGYFIWFAIIAVLTAIEIAEPGVKGFFEKLMKVEVDRNWNLDVLNFALYFSVISLAYTTITLLINMKRHRRKRDRYSFPLVFNLVFSIGVIIFCMVKIYG